MSTTYRTNLELNRISISLSETLTPYQPPSKLMTRIHVCKQILKSHQERLRVAVSHCYTKPIMSVKDEMISRLFKASLRQLVSKYYFQQASRFILLTQFHLPVSLIFTLSRASHITICGFLFIGL